MSSSLGLWSAGGAASCAIINRPSAAMDIIINSRKSLTCPSLAVAAAAAAGAVAASASARINSNHNGFNNKKFCYCGSCCTTITTATTNSSANASRIEKTRRRSRRVIACEVALRSENSSTSSAISTDDDDDKIKKKIGGRVRVNVPLKVYHVPRVDQVDLTGKEGYLKQYVGLWKGKRISANLPYKVEFVVDIQGRGPVKFFAHLKEDEFEFLD